MATATATTTTPERLPLRLEDVPPAPPRRPRVLLIGTTMASAASIALFGGLLAAYFALRADVVGQGEQWLPDGTNIPLSPGNMTMVTLAMSLITAQWAVHAGKLRDRGHAYFALGLTVLLGIAHVVQLGFLFTQWELPLNAADGESVTTQAVLLFTIMGLHIAMVAAALIFFTLMLLRSLGGQFTGRDVEGLSAAALYWYVTVGIFVVLWYGILIVK
ncbi:MAG TPA: cytochrome c oxidase subunit 3 [Acidimicrobiales bacterium]|nr:cytochrome c oxidase subunit 3 [Acidimicrobiales bacterium]